VKETGKAAKGSRRWAVLALVVLGAALGIYLLRNRLAEFHWETLRSTFAAARLDQLLIAICLVLLTYVIRAVRWRLMLRPIAPAASVGSILSPTIVGFTAVVLFGRAGEMVRPYLIATRNKVPFSSQVAAWALERILDLLAVLLLFAIALTQVHSSGMKAGPNLAWLLSTGGWVIGGAAFLCLLMILLFRYFTEPMQLRLLEALSFLPPVVLGRIANLLRAFSSGMSSTRSGGVLAGLLGYTFLDWAVIAAGFYFAFRAVPVTAGFSITDTLIVLGFLAIGSAIQLPGIGGGMQIATVVVLTELFSLDLETATGIAILLWIVSFVTVIPFGVALALHEGLRWKNLRGIAEELEQSPGGPPSVS
jgi:uncharacterized protein (TIRG00374 family)